MANFGILLFLAVPVFCLPVHQSSAVESTTTSPLSNRQVGDGVTGNQTGSSGSITNSGGPGDGNGVGFAGTGNDIDTGMCSLLIHAHTPMTLRRIGVQARVQNAAEMYMQVMTSILATAIIR